MMKITCALLVVAVSSVVTAAQPASTLKAGAKVYVAAMPDGFDSYLKSALEKKKVPVSVVPSRDEAEYEIKGTAESQKASAAKKIIMGSWHSDEQASISVTNLRTGDVVFAYSANKKNSAHGKQSSAEACAKHLKEAIEKAK
jgi:hypothetical protein